MLPILTGRSFGAQAHSARTLEVIHMGSQPAVDMDLTNHLPTDEGATREDGFLWWS